jgi:deoxyribodipyrimidine photo-lyase
VIPDALQHPTLQELGFTPSELWLEPGATAARQRLVEFGETMADYSEGRNFPARPGGTSGLSVHLRHGTISIRECVRFGLAHPGKGADKWVNELGWRDFYHMIMARFPHAMNGAFKPEFDEVPWQDHPEHFEAWCQGRTGYPIVDAAMRCLNATGWMHNRSRMIVASFLTKDLLIHWQRGEAYFARKLLDFELASNNGGWQWASSTGVDAQPHFRIFNPYLQSVKFDPDGVFLREWLPELAALPTKHLHVPSEVPVMELLAQGVVLGETYPYPIVDHAIQRNLAIEMLSSVLISRPCSLDVEQVRSRATLPSCTSREVLKKWLIA